MAFQRAIVEIFREMDSSTYKLMPHEVGGDVQRIMSRVRQRESEREREREKGKRASEQERERERYICAAPSQACKL